MINKKKILCIIPARKGSKGILNKNIKWKNPYGNGNASFKSYKIIKDFLIKNNAKFY